MNTKLELSLAARDMIWQSSNFSISQGPYLDLDADYSSLETPKNEPSCFSGVPMEKRQEVSSSLLFLVFLA